MSSIPFERYDEEFLSLTEQVTSKIRALDPATTTGSNAPATAAADLKMAHNLLLQADDLLKQMGLEARGAEDAVVKRDLLGKVRVCKTRLANLRDDYEAAKTQLERSALGLSNDMESNGSRSSSARGGSKERLLSNTDALHAQSETLANARSVMAETESVAMEITEELGRHRETISSAHGRVRQVTGMTNRARRIVQNMSRREVQQKLILYGVGGSLLWCFCF
ncbi:hypothetical protein HJC23_013546 [Cyclotella cryptica]|uniref:Vesicle transport v-SNARE N-terminal domain-containing protein n=1 Tax=Cyclotella cryptica TaxID=29204 RepID=A0ABD3P5S9_9STRA|eukprot:CCRYP_017351-RA/>CCRYP_017351-RA protein AED:0.13 eAED:0.13 QI:463/1/1/1/1/1/2/463/222